MKSNISLIGMPGSGKSTVGASLAKHISYGFIDTDDLIRQNQNKSLQTIIDESGYQTLREIEEEELLMLLQIDKQVIATGGSAVYSGYAMSHLKKISTVVYLEASFDLISERIKDFDTRGIAKADNQTFEDLFKERQVLYEQYADLKIDCNQDQHAIAHEIMTMLHLSHSH